MDDAPPLSIHRFPLFNPSSKSLQNQTVEAAVLHYKRGEVSAEGRESALKSEVDELRSRGDTEGAAVEGKEKTTATVGVMARPEAGEGLSTRATGVNTEEVSRGGGCGGGDV